MMRPQYGRRSPFVILVLAATFALAFTGALLATADEAGADLPQLAPFRAVDVFPVIGETDAPLVPLVKVNFNIPFKPGTITGDSFYIEKPGGAKAKGHFAFDTADTRALLMTDEVLQPGTTYKVVLTSAIKSKGLLSYSLLSTTWTFRTTTPPKVVSTTPAASATSVAVDQAVRVTFDRDIDPATVKHATFYLKEHAGFFALDSQIFCEANKRDIMLVPAAQLKKNTTYEVILTTGMKGANGLPLEKQVSWLFTTVAPALPPPPPPVSLEVVEKTPAPEAKDVHPGSHVQVTFNTVIDPATVNASTFSLYELHTGPVPAATLFSLDGRTITLRPNDPLNWNKTYRTTLTTGVKALNGPALPRAVTWIFTTAAAPPLPPPPPTVAFTDVKPNHPYYDAIMELASRGIVSGYGDGRFGPADPVRRAQFAKMIVGVLGLPVTEDDFPHPDIAFTDLGQDNPTDLYPHEYVSVCFRNGITLGKDATHFAPYDFITRYQVITMVVRAVDKLRPGYLTTPPPGFGAWRGDPDHGANAARAEYSGLLEGLGHSGGLQSLDPYDDMTRGEVAQVLYTLLLLRTPVVT
ncbi:MAG: hypothetical protein GX604_00700 [Actinobacteria bacterium]|nr:hypothetical protein [Actinomycetota bacterium]